MVRSLAPPLCPAPISVPLSELGSEIPLRRAAGGLRLRAEREWLVRPHAGHARADAAPIVGEALLQMGHVVPAVFVASPWQIRRIRGLVRQRGGQWVLARARGQIGRIAPSADLERLRHQYALSFRSITGWARSRSVRLVRVKNLNDSNTVGRLADEDPDAVLYGGGGFLGSFFSTRRRGF